MKWIIGFYLFLVNCVTSVLHAEIPSHYDILRVTNTIQNALPEIKIDAVESGPYPSIYQVTAGNEILYITTDGKYLLYGAILDLQKNKKDWNLTEQSKKKITKAIIDKLDLKDMIIFKPEKVIGIVTIFTDVDCGYCRKSHAKIKEIMAKGIEVRYLAFPRAGTNSPTYNKMVSIWCNDSRREALTKVKNGEAIPSKTCTNPAATQFDVGQKIGVPATPTMIFTDGTMLPGYFSVDNLLEQVIKHSLITTDKGK